MYSYCYFAYRKKQFWPEPKEKKTRKKMMSTALRRQTKMHDGFSKFMTIYGYDIVAERKIAIGQPATDDMKY